jgi:ribonucleoside-diphosphate reductase beta chain
MALERDILAGSIDIDSEVAPVVETDRLYRLWEEGNWSAKAIDFSRDRVDWHDRMTEQTRAATLWNCALFLDGEESVTVTLAPFMQALTRYEDRIFLATQIADEARHHVFFDRFLREVVGVGTDYASTLAATRANLTWGYMQVFTELDRVADRLRRQPENLPLLAQGITLYHLVVEGMLAHTGQHFLREYSSAHNLFPGFLQGIKLLTRDESRHIAFGIQVLHDLVTQDDDCKAAAIAMLNRVLPWAAGTFTPPDIDWGYLTCLGYQPQEVMAFGLRSLETKLRRAGIPPEEVLALAKLDIAASPAVQADRAIALIEGGVIGTQASPRVSEPTMTALFASMQDAARWTAARAPQPGATIQWIFDGAAPRALELGATGGALARAGMAPGAELTLRCTATDWILIAGGRLDQRVALLRRRLRISGDWRLALRLPGIIPV